MQMVLIKKRKLPIGIGITAIFLICLVFTGIHISGCGGVAGFLEIGDCDEVTTELPAPATDQFDNTSLGFGFYNNGNWFIDENTKNKIDTDFLKTVECARDKLKLSFALEIELAAPIEGIDIPASSEDALILSRETDKVISMSGPNELYDPESEFDYSEEELADLQSRLLTRTEEVLTLTIPSDFRIILTDQDKCLLERGVWGVTKFYMGHLFIWINRPGELAQHEFTHVIAVLLNLTDEQEKDLEACTPGINHVDL